MENQTQQVQPQPEQKKKWYKKWWGILLIIFGLLIIFSIFGNDDEKNESISQTVPTKEINEKKEVAENVNKVEETTDKDKDKDIRDPEEIVLSDTGQQASNKFTLEKGLSIFRITHTGMSHFSVTLLDENGQYTKLLANTTGTFDGSKAVEIEKRGEYILDISADGKWTVGIKQPRKINIDENKSNFTGIGQQVSPFFKLDKGLTKFSLKHSGKGHFGVVLMNREGEYIELLANETGIFDGSKAVGINQASTYLLDIAADGNWEISFE